MNLARPVWVIFLKGFGDKVSYKCDQNILQFFRMKQIFNETMPVENDSGGGFKLEPGEFEFYHWTSDLIEKLGSIPTWF